LEKGCCANGGVGGAVKGKRQLIAEGEKTGHQGRKLREGERVSNLWKGEGLARREGKISTKKPMQGISTVNLQRNSRG